MQTYRDKGCSRRYSLSNMFFCVIGLFANTHVGGAALHTKAFKSAHHSSSLNSTFFDSGSLNSSFFNSGSFNSGSFNSGSFNSGSFNSGSFNSGSRASKHTIESLLFGSKFDADGKSDADSLKYTLFYGEILKALYDDNEKDFFQFIRKNVTP